MMQNKKLWMVILVLIIVGMSSCVKKYEPDFDLKQSQKLVISGNLTDSEGDQIVRISLTSPTNLPSYIPLTKCKVKLIASDGSRWDYHEIEDGKYILQLAANELNLSLSYYLDVLTPDNQRIVSSEEFFSDCPNVDNLHYEIAEYTNVTTGNLLHGLQFFIDFKGTETDSRYYYYEVIETSEFHAPRPIEWWYDGVVHHEVPPDYSKSLCWNTQIINDIFVLSTDNLSANEFLNFKLNFTDNQSQRLRYLYSLNVKQYSLSKEAYIYWNQMQINKHQSGGLYNSQPIAVKGNFKNTTNQESDVLGFFMVTKLKERRFFIPPQNIQIIDNTCSKPAVLRFGLRDISPIQYPAYLDGDQNRYFNMLLDKGCVDCTSDGGTTVKPSFWPI